MKFKAEINIMPLEVLLDPQGKVVTSGLNNLGLGGISNVRIGKHITFDIEADDKKTAGNIAEDACQNLLANSVIEAYEIDIH